MKELYEQNYDDGVILAVSNSYEQLYYFNEDFDAIPEIVQQELKIMLVLHTEEIGGIIAVGFDTEGNLYIEGTAKEYDAFYDDIGSHLKIKQYQRENKELFESLEKFYEQFF